MKVCNSLLTGIFLAGISCSIGAGLTGCHAGNKNSMVGDSTANDVTQRPVSQADTGAKKDITYEAGSQMDSTNAGNPSLPNKKDARFAVNAYRGGLLEVELGRIAQNKATDPGIRDFGAMMVRDHSKGVETLKALASSQRVAVPDSVSGIQQRDRDRLQSESGSDFDRDYIDMMVRDHKNDILEFKAEIINGQDSTFKSFAEQSMRMLNTHLDRAEYIQGKMR